MRDARVHQKIKLHKRSLYIEDTQDSTRKWNYRKRDGNGKRYAQAQRYKWHMFVFGFVFSSSHTDSNYGLSE